MEHAQAVARIADNRARLLDQIAAAATAVGRSPESVTLVAVTKYGPADLARAAVAAGCLNLGENRPQALWDKAAALADLPVRWHLIGQLQRNKVRRTLPLVHLIHSVDTPKLLADLEAEAVALGQPRQVLLEVNISGEEAKHGFSPADVRAALEQAASYSQVRIQGLMGMAPLEGGPAVAAPYFEQLAILRDTLITTLPGTQLPELSMGMSGDFAAAIAAGATLVRIGSTLFEGVL